MRRKRTIERKGAKQMKKISTTILLTLSSIFSNAQDFGLPVVEELFMSIDIYYEELTKSQKKENEEEGKMNWLNYIPSPHYSPFSGGFGATLNISAPIQAIEERHRKRLKNSSIEKINKLQAKDLKNQISYQHQTIKIAIEEYYQHKIIDSLRKKSFDLSEKSYIKNKITPSEFLQIQETNEVYKLNKISERNNIKRTIIQLCMIAKKVATANSDF